MTRFIENGSKKPVTTNMEQLTVKVKKVCVRVCVYGSVFLCVSICVSVCVRVCGSLYMRACVWVCAWECVSICACKCVSVCLCVHVCTPCKTFLSALRSSGAGSAGAARATRQPVSRSPGIDSTGMLRTWVRRHVSISDILDIRGKKKIRVSYFSRGSFW